MKKTDFMEKLAHIISRVDFGGDKAGMGYDKAAEFVWEELEKLGIVPPSVSEEDRQCLMGIYYGGYSFNQWDEDLEKDEKVQDLKKRRALLASMTREERMELHREAVRKLNEKRENLFAKFNPKDDVETRKGRGKKR